MVEALDVVALVGIEEKLSDDSLNGSERRKIMEEWWLEFSLASNNGNRARAAEWSGRSVRTLTNTLLKFPHLKYKYPRMVNLRASTAKEKEQKRIMDKRFPNY